MNSGSGQSIANSQFPGQGNALSDDPGTLESVPEVSTLDSAAPSSSKTETTEEKTIDNEKKMSYDMQTQATELRSMSTQTDTPSVDSQQRRSNTNAMPRSFSQSALRSGNLDAGKPIVLVQQFRNTRQNLPLI